jgi:hypothetical protein
MTVFLNAIKIYVILRSAPKGRVSKEAGPRCNLKRLTGYLPALSASAATCILMILSGSETEPLRA